MTLNKLHLALLKSCAEDHVALWFAMTEIEETYKDEIRNKTLEILPDLLEEDLIQAGAPTPNGRDFVKWPLSTSEIIERIRREWAVLGRDSSIGDIVWFTTTDNGDRKLRVADSTKH